VSDERLITLGCDVGCIFTKAALLRDDALLATRVSPTTGRAAEQTAQLIDALLAEAGVAPDRLDGVAATGSGAEFVPDADFDDKVMACVGAAVRRLLPGVDLVIDVGGQSITSFSLDPAGEVADFMRNDKCASGTGRFLEVMGQALGLQIDALDASAASAAAEAAISSQCGVFVESEVITHLNDGVPPEEIAAGLCDAVACIVVSQAQRFSGGVSAPYTITGGVARLEAVTSRVRRRLGGELVPYPNDPMLAAAHGAALLAAAAEEA
jgi:(R)-2-hydroxyacyl-CoA dehydratese activating ATPase